MKRFLQHRSNRWGYDGWGVRVKGASRALNHTVCTTREEAREVRAEMEADLFTRTEVVKVKISVVVVPEARQNTESE